MSRHLHRAALVLAAATLAACSDAHTPTAATTAAPVAQRALLSGSVDLALVTQQAVELDRVGEIRADARTTLDSLQQRWNASGGAIPTTTPALFCAPRMYDADVKIIGPAGGVLRAGQHTLRIPKGALRQPTVITMEAPVSLAVAVRFAPHGLTFDVAPTLTLDYRKCTVPGGSTMSVAYVDGDLNVLERPRSRDRKGAVSAEIWHFSDYIVAW